MLNAQFIAAGLVIQRHGRHLECVRTLQTNLIFQDIEDGSYVELDTSDFLTELAEQKTVVVDAKATDDYIDFPDSEPESTVPFFALTDSQQIKLDIRLTFVKGIHKRKITRGQRRFLEEAAAEITKEINDRIEDPRHTLKSPPSPATLNRWLHRYEVGRLEASSLIPLSALKSHPHRLDPRNEALVDEAIRTTLFATGIRNISEIHRSYLDQVERYNRQQRAHQKPELPAVGLATLWRRIQAIPKIERDTAIYGRQQAGAMNRVSQGHLPSAFALEYVEIDHGQLDIYVIDDLLYIPLGLPWITIFRDRHTGIVLGFYISFRKTSLQSIFGGIRHSIYPHDRVSTIWPDISSYWPAGFGLNYVSDRGGDFLSPRYRLALWEMGSDPQYCERKTPWHKAGIERFIGQTNHELLETLPGKTFPFRGSPRDYDSRRQAVIRFSTLVYLIHKWIAEAYHHSPHSRKLASPLERWDKSVAEMPIPVPPSPDKLLVITGELHQRKIGYDGITFEWLNYTAPELQDICNDLGHINIPTIINPDNLAHASAIDPRTKRSFRMFSTTPEYTTGLSLIQHRFLRRNTKIELTRSNAAKTLNETRAMIQETLAEEILQKQTAEKLRLHKAAILAGINSNSVLDGEIRSVADVMKAIKAVESRHTGFSRQETDANTSAGSNDIPHFSWI